MIMQERLGAKTMRGEPHLGRIVKGCISLTFYLNLNLLNTQVSLPIYMPLIIPPFLLITIKLSLLIKANPECALLGASL